MLLLLNGARRNKEESKKEKLTEEYQWQGYGEYQSKSWKTEISQVISESLTRHVTAGIYNGRKLKHKLAKQEADRAGKIKRILNNVAKHADCRSRVSQAENFVNFDAVTLKQIIVLGLEGNQLILLFQSDV